MEGRRIDDCEYIAEIETLGSGDQMLDVITMRDGSVLMITCATLVLYESRQAFESATGGTRIPRMPPSSRATSQ